MSIENEICLWCQDSLKGQGPVMELTTDDFKLMFKHDATSKIIHCACYRDYQEKRAKEISDDEQKSAHGQSDPVSDQRRGPRTGRIERPHWWRILIAALSNQHTTVRLGIRGVPRTTASWLERAQLCNVNPRQAIPAMARQESMEQYYHSNSLYLPRASPIQPPQTMSVPVMWSRRSIPPQPSHLPSAPVQISRPHEGWLVPPQGQRTVFQSTQAFRNRFAPFNNPQGCFLGPLDSRQMADATSHFQVQQNLYPIAYTLPQQATGTYWSYSVVSHTHNSAGLQSVYQERIQCRW